jgi:transcription antitermination factor NusG
VVGEAAEIRLHAADLHGERAEMTAWFAVHCAPSAESSVAIKLARKSFNVFFPHTVETIRSTREARERYVRRAHLTGYLFVQLEQGSSAFDVNETDGVIALVCGSSSAPVSISDEVMHRLFALADDTGRVRCMERKGRQFQGNKGDHVKFGTSSALCGVVGEIERVLEDSGRIEVRVHKIFGAERIVLCALADVGELIRKGPHKSRSRYANAPRVLGG